jgi:hypothetical protein
MNHQTILKMVSEELVSGLHLTNEKIPKTLCAACELGKFHRQPLKIGRTRATRIGELVHSDVEGPMPSPSIGQARYYVLFTDDFSGWRVIYFMKCKSEVPVCFRLFIASLLSETGKTIRTLRSDNGGEYSGNDFKTFLTEKGIRHETSAAKHQLRTVLQKDRIGRYWTHPAAYFLQAIYLLHSGPKLSVMWFTSGTVYYPAPSKLTRVYISNINVKGR